MDGLIGLDKPQGLTSFDVVARIRRAAKQKKVGHTGTLDPDATGVLVVCLGAATRLSSRLMAGSKRYTAGLFLGKSTVTGDATGEAIQDDRAIKIQPAQIIKALEGFTGEMMQIPPMFSALKKDGKRLYEMARLGESVEREPRKIIIDSIEADLSEASGSFSYGDVIKLDITCSQGTYIRTLCEDIGKSMGIPAHMSSLRRTFASGFAIEDCITLDEAEKLAEKGMIGNAILPLGDALPDMPRIPLTAFETERVSSGGEILVGAENLPGESMLIGHGGTPIAIASVEAAGNCIGKMIVRPKVVFNTTEGR